MVCRGVLCPVLNLRSGRLRNVENRWFQQLVSFLFSVFLLCHTGLSQNRTRPMLKPGCMSCRVENLSLGG